MPLITLDRVPVREIFPGFRARIVHSGRTSHSWVEIDAGARFAEHHHPHEQVVNVLEGELELTCGAEVHRLTPGRMFVIPPNVSHSGVAITACSTCLRRCATTTSDGNLERLKVARASTRCCSRSWQRRR